MKSKIYLTSNDVDMMIITEGTYPFVIGGVASWTDKLIKYLPDIKFGVVFLGGTEEEYPELKFDLPANLVHLEAHFLFEDQVIIPKGKKLTSKDFKKIYEMHDKFKEKRTDYLSIIQLLREELKEENHVTIEEFLYSEDAWNYIVHTYNERCPEISFLDYFWTIRNLHLPIWGLIKAAPHVPCARAYHTLSTGYAGFLGTLLKDQYKKPFILTEHGIYTKERKIDLLQNQWAVIGHHSEQRITETAQYVSQLWVSFFQVLAKFCYASADPIISLFSNYQTQQIEAGAKADRTMIIPNGVAPYKREVKSAPDHKKPILGLIGRVVPIKDIKTFITAMVLIHEHIPDAEAWIIGPLDVDPNYVNECMHLANVLNISDKIIYKGMQNVTEMLSYLDVIIISSISEGMPLVLLEGFAAGIPAVATDVGACRELIEGRDKEDSAMGKSGMIVDICNPKALADAVITLLQDKDKWVDAQKAGMKRVAEYYSFDEFIKNYQTIYHEAINNGRN